MTAAGPDCRFAINLANAALVKLDSGGGLQGLAVDVARRVAEQLGRRPELLRYESAAAVLADAKTGWDIAFLAVDPKRSDIVAFTRPYLIFEVGCAVRMQSNLIDAPAVDRPGIAIACANGAYASTIRQRIVKARIVEAASPADALHMLEAERVDCAVGLVPALEEAARTRPIRRLTGALAQVEHALAVPAACRDLLPALEAALQTP